MVTYKLLRGDNMKARHNKGSTMANQINLNVVIDQNDVNTGVNLINEKDMVVSNNA